MYYAPYTHTPNLVCPFTTDDYHIYSTTWKAVGLGGDSITDTWWDNIPSKYPQH